MVRDDERYLFDLQGYLVLRGVLGPRELAELNEIVDSRSLPPPGDTIDSQRFGGFLTWGQPFRDLLDHPRVLPLLEEWVDPAMRLDRYYGIYMRAGTGGLPLHGGGGDLDDPTAYFRHQQGRMLNGVTTVSWALTDMMEGQGGFVAIPGSHKSNYPQPEELDWRAPCATHLEMRAGDLVIFTGAVAHGTVPWTAGHQRRSLLFKYAPGHLAFSPSYLERSPELAEVLTPRQLALLQPPYAYHRRSIEPSIEQVHRYADATANYNS